MAVIIACVILVIWFFVFGLECYLNGLMCQEWWAVPFVGLYQDIKWLFFPIEDGPGIVHFVLMHGSGIGIPVWLIFMWINS